MILISKLIAKFPFGHSAGKFDPAAPPPAPVLSKHQIFVSPIVSPQIQRPKLDWVWISKPFMYVKAFLKRNVVLAGYNSVPDTKFFFFNA